MSPKQSRTADRARRTLRLEIFEDRLTPATFYVTTPADVVDANDSRRSLREAITQANNNPGADVIVVPAGEFKIGINGAGEAGNASGDFDITDSVTIRGAGGSRTFIDGQQLDRVFHGTGTSLINVVLQGMTIRNGAVSDPVLGGGGVLVNNVDLVLLGCTVTENRASGSGGGISNSYTSEPGGHVKLVRCLVTNNVSANGFGGGINFEGPGTFTVTSTTIRRNFARFIGGGIFSGTVKLTRCTINANLAEESGGGIYSAGEAELTSCMVSGNATGAFGGGIYGDDKVIVIGCTISGNGSWFGGGGINARVTYVKQSKVIGNAATGDGGGVRATEANLERSTVLSNTANGQGGGVWASEKASVYSSTLYGNVAGTFGGGLAVANGTGSLTNSTVEGNRAWNSGGGINAELVILRTSTVNGNTAALDGGGLAANRASLHNSTISGNTAGDQGGGAWVATLGYVANCTVVDNLAAYGGGLFNEGSNSFGVTNTIVAKNMATSGAPDVSGAFNSTGNNLIGDGSGSSAFSIVTDDIVGTNLNPIDPKLGALAYNGGPTKTHRLLAGSRAIDAGNNASVLPNDTDQRGVARIRDGNRDGIRVVDIGAFER